MRSLLFVATLSFCLNSAASVSEKLITATFANSCFNQTIITETENPFDLAIFGKGWLPLQEPNGQIVYTRYGALGMDKYGFLSHRPSGLPVVIAEPGGGFQKINLKKVASKPSVLDQGSKADLINFEFTEAGSIEASYSDGQNISIAKLTLTTFENERKLKLKDKGTHLFEAPSTVGEIGYSKLPAAPFGKIYARGIESSISEQYKKKCE